MEYVAIRITFKVIMKHHLKSNHVFHCNLYDITPKLVTSLRGPSLRYCAWKPATQLLSKKCRSSDELLAIPCRLDQSEIRTSDLQTTNQPIRLSTFDIISIEFIRATYKNRRIDLSALKTDFRTVVSENFIQR